MPLMFGIFMSVMMTSNSALSSFLLAASPELTVSILWPSRRKAISSISQMERSSSQTRMLAMRSPSRRRTLRFPLPITRRQGLLPCAGSGRPPCSEIQTPQPKYKGCAFAQPRTRPHFTFMRLRNLIHDRQSESGSSIEPRLERLENLFGLLRAHAVAGISEVNLPVISGGLHRNRQHATVLHGAHCVLAKVPENLLDPVAVSQHKGVLDVEIAFNANAGVLRHQTVIKQRQRVFQQRH